MAGTSKVAGGNIAPSRFVRLSPTQDGVAFQCGANQVSYGISGPAVRNFPYGGLDDGFHAIAGGNCQVYGIGERCWLLLGGPATPGTFLKSDASGRGIATVTANEWYGAIALQAGTTGDLVEVEVQQGFLGTI